MRDFFDFRVLCCAFILLVVGLFLISARDTEEMFVVLYGYFPTVGIAFTLATSHLVDKKGGFTALMIITYTILQYTLLNHSININISGVNLKLTIFAAIGASLTLLYFNVFSDRPNHNLKGYGIIFFLGVLSFIPQQINFNIQTLLISIFLWQLLIGFFTKYAKQNTAAISLLQQGITNKIRAV